MVLPTARDAAGLHGRDLFLGPGIHLDGSHKREVHLETIPSTRLHTWHLPVLTAILCVLFYCET